MIIKAIYKTLRSIIFTLTLLAVGLYVAVYILVSIPGFTNYVKNRAALELTNLTGGRVQIDQLRIYPFNEINISGLSVRDLQGEECLQVKTIGGGIRLWKLITEGSIEISYGEIIGLEANIIQEKKDTALNIQFLIDAFASKDDKKEKKQFELALRNVVVRKGSINFKRPWLEGEKVGSLDLSDLQISDLAADIAFPKIYEEGVEVDLRRLSFTVPSALKLERLGLNGKFSKTGLEVKNFILELPGSRIYMPEFSLPLKEGENLAEKLKRYPNELWITESYITPGDFSFLYPGLTPFTEALPLEIDVIGNIEKISVRKFSFGLPEILYLTLNGEIEGLEDLNSGKGDVSDLKIQVSSLTFQRIAEGETNMKPKVKEFLSHIGNLDIQGEISGAMNNRSVIGNLSLMSEAFNIDIEGGIERINNGFKGEGEINLKDVNLQMLLPHQPFGIINANLVAEGEVKENQPEGMMSLVIENFEYKGKFYEGLSLNINKDKEDISGDLMIHNEIADIESVFKGDIEGEAKSADLTMDIQRLALSEVLDMKAYKDYIIKGKINAKGDAVGIDDIRGTMEINNLSFISPDNHHNLKLHQLKVDATVEDSIHSIVMRSDWIDLRAEGPYKLRTLPQQLMSMASSVMPALIPSHKRYDPEFASDMEFDIVIKNNNAIPEFFNLPFRFLVPLTLNGSIEGSHNTASMTLDVPYLQQGKDKLIYDSRVIANIDGNRGVFDGLITTTMPVKHGDLALNVELWGEKNGLSTDLHWINTENSEFKGHLSLETIFARNELTSTPEFTLNIMPSVIQMGPADWNVSRSSISYSDKCIKVKGLVIGHDDQFVEIEGTASAEYADEIKVNLADIDVDYVFDLLQINYVTFGGTATGEVIGHALLSGNPVAETESFYIKEFTYNGCDLGTCLATSKWNNEQKEIEISADISKDGERIVLGSGGIWLGRDSLSFDISATKVPVDFVQPFMAVFSSHVGGFATGDVKLYGTFHDIDMAGTVYADSVAVKLDYTNTVYHGSDTVYLLPGKIDIPHFELFDKYGHSAMLTGELTHRYFHDPSFTFRLSDAQDFLCYDTSAELNPDWYGILYGTGSALLRGVPGQVDISADMTVTGNSSFTFVLNETQYAKDYQFLTFSDRRKEALQKQEGAPMTVDDYKELLKKKMNEDQGSLSKFGIDIRATVTPQTLFTLVMDPAAGDKITARGRGAMQVKYESDEEEMMMYGKYEIDEGNYNFSLQDIILRDFKIKEGSYISFNGNPLAADLDISATYRVNTNLSDLDKSFSTDRDLNRTNVPVDAVLSVTGDMQSPDITFDIELPTLTQDVERKVKSIISTDDMMNRQIIYLLALNRFYTPEYMGVSGNGGELAAVASSTISSQLSNILGQLTDKVSVSPSFRSDKGDFSDIEVDVALSSRLLNNRLLINGNFGYRDRSTSSTTFVGDFDVEYLLSKNGNLRLKAYNHFNDQNYYLREALTTQGLGVVYRKDFDDWFKFLRRKERKRDESEDSNIEKGSASEVKEGNGNQN